MAAGFNLILDHTRSLGPNILHLAFRLESGEKFNFIPGQFITFLLKNSEGVLKRRSYSVASQPCFKNLDFKNLNNAGLMGSVDLIEIAVSYVPGGIASECLFNLKPGEILNALGPVGKLIIQEPELNKRHILIGTGTGIAPYRAMLNLLAEKINQDPNFKIIILFGAQYLKDLLYLEDFLEFKNKYKNNCIFRAQLSREKLEDKKLEGQDYLYSGYVQTAFEDLNLNPESDLIFLCGNPKMIDSAFMDLQLRGFESKNIKREKYISSN